jgi:hydroxyacylglutathione hydrolase
MEITHIFDTSSSANPLNGNTELETRTGARVYYLRNTEDMFSHLIIEEGDTFDFGQARIEIINSPMHDPYVNSIRVKDTFHVDSPWMILKRESLFIGNIGKPESEGSNLSEEIFHFLECNEDIYDQTASDSSDFNRYPGDKKSSEYAAHSMG